MMQHHSSALPDGDHTSARAFSTRFLPSDGIPAYNALLDSHLGKRREFLLGNRKSLELLQQTGVISRVQAKEDNPNQYVVYMTEKAIHRRKRLPPRLAVPGDALAETPWRSGQRYPSLRKSETAPHLKSRFSADREEDRDRHDCTEEETGNEHDDVSTSMVSKQRRSAPAKKSAASKARHADKMDVHANSSPGAGSSMSNKLSMAKSLGRSVSTTTLTRASSLLREVDPGLGDARKSEQPEVADAEKNGEKSDPNRSRMRSKSVIAAPLYSPKLPDTATNDAKQQHSISAQQKKPPLKGAVEHLLESDASYMAQIRVMKDQLVDLDQEKSRLDAEVAHMRKRLRGVNAVHENDVAVAHCSSIMQHRLSKAEEEYMKLLTAQLQVKKDVDRVRRELLSLKKVKKKLEADIEEVRQMNAAIEDKIRASKMIRNLVSAELVELEKKTELAVEEQRLNLPPEEAVVVDVEKLMSAVQERNSNRRIPPGASTLASHASSLSLLATPFQTPSNLDTSSKPQLDFRVGFSCVAC